MRFQVIRPGGHGWRRARVAVQSAFGRILRALIFMKGSAMGVITRAAGTGTVGNTGDDGPATVAQLHEPTGVAVTADGGFLFADDFNNDVVRKVSAAGVITRVAGTGTPGNSGDDDPATDAQLNSPFGGSGDRRRRVPVRRRPQQRGAQRVGRLARSSRKGCGLAAVQLGQALGLARRSAPGAARGDAPDRHRAFGDLTQIRYRPTRRRRRPVDPRGTTRPGGDRRPAGDHVQDLAHAPGLPPAQLRPMIGLALDYHGSEDFSGTNISALPCHAWPIPEALTNRPCRIRAEIPMTGSLRPTSLQASGLLDLSGVVVYKTAVQAAAFICALSNCAMVLKAVSLRGSLTRPAAVLIVEDARPHMRTRSTIAPGGTWPASWQRSRQHSC